MDKPNPDYDPKVNLPYNAIDKAAQVLLDVLPDEVRCYTADGGVAYINPEWVEHLADHLQHVIACVIAGIIDAGSERDAVMENGQLNSAIQDELRGWVI